MNKILSVSIFLLISYGSLCQSISIQKYYIDRLHSSVNFSVEYLEVMEFTGRADDYFGQLNVEKKDTSNWSFEFIVKTGSMNTAMINRDKDLHSEKYMDTKKFRALSFRSKEIFSRNGILLAKGDLKVKGITRQIELPFKILTHKKRPNSEEQLMVVDVGPILIKRSDYEIGTISRTKMDEIFLGDIVKIWAKVLLRSESENDKTLFNSYSSVALTNDELNQFIGTYNRNEKATFLIEKLDGKLFFVWPDAAVMRLLTPVSRNEFFIHGIGYILNFQFENGEVISVTYQRGEDNTRWWNLKKTK